MNLKKAKIKYCDKKLINDSDKEKKSYLCNWLFAKRFFKLDYKVTSLLPSYDITDKLIK